MNMVLSTEQKYIQLIQMLNLNLKCIDKACKESTFELQQFAFGLRQTLLEFGDLNDENKIEPQTDNN